MRGTAATAPDTDEPVRAAPLGTAARESYGFGWLVIALAFVLSQLVVVLGAAVAGSNPFDASSYARWDSVQYLDVAEHGYDLHRCDARISDESIYGRGDWCGNAGWFPGYAVAIDAVSSVFPIARVTAGVLLAHIAHVAFLAAMWFGFLRRRARAPAVLALLLIACFPGFAYQDAVFPVSIALAALAASLLYLARGRPLAGGVIGAVAVVTYPSGVMLVGVCVLWVLLCRWSGHREVARAGTVSRYVVPLVVAYAGVMAGFQLAVGHWNAWMLVQRHYGYGPTFFLDAWWSHVRMLVPVWIGTTAPALQTILVAALVVGGLATAWRYRPELDRLELAVVAYAVVFWLAPLSLGGALSLYRAEALLAPVAVLSVRWRRSAQVSALVASGIIGLLMAIAFFEGALV